MVEEGLKTKNVELVEETMCLAVKEHVQIEANFMLIITNWLSQQANLKLLHERGQDTVGLEKLSKEELNERTKAAAMQEYQDAQAAQAQEQQTV